eukprot:CAMPEP_0116955552 /NCGR_PEP_ID=MMETSP0467-20121206/42697_1 /TAXON_ID=283647 /ORGANISM="Mesodinium pulex, Strain SPMC105" /LENGTH=36 /DNA_ID= /DNA_START= /DNA_END= /DNA_ORIENTATION=
MWWSFKQPLAALRPGTFCAPGCPCKAPTEVVHTAAS